MVAMWLFLDFAVNGQLLVYWGFLLDVGVANGRLLRIRYCEDLWLGASRAMIYRLYSWIAEFARAVDTLPLMDLVVGLGCRGRPVQRHGPGERYLESTRAQTKAQAVPGFTMESHEDVHVMILKVVRTQSIEKLVRASPSSCRSLAPGPDATTAFTTVTTINPRPTGGSIADYRDAITSGDTAAISVYCTVLGTPGTQQSFNKEVTLK